MILESLANYLVDSVVGMINWLLSIGLAIFKPDALSLPAGSFLLPSLIVIIIAFLICSFIFEQSVYGFEDMSMPSFATIVITFMMTVVIVVTLINAGTDFIYGPSYTSNEATRSHKVYREMTKDTKRLNDFTTLYDENSSATVKGSVTANNLIRHKDAGSVLPALIKDEDDTIFETGSKIQRRQFDDEIVPLINKHADFDLNVKIGSANEDMNAQIDDVVVDKSEVASDLENSDFEYTISKIEWSDAVEYITWMNVRSERNVKVIKLYLKAHQTQESIDRRKLEQLKGS